MEQIVFYILAGVALLSALYVVTGQNLVRSVFMFFVTLFAVAGLYVFALADFVALTQIVIYVGGVLVMLLFVFMLSTKNSLEGLSSLKKDKLSENRLPATVLCLALAGILIYAILSVDFGSLSWIQSAIASGDVKQPTDNNITNIGVNLMSRYLLPFEVISIFLMMVLIGAAHLARKENNL
ncbi:NADH-quinone oxidoreductase subunit J [Pseudopedobacter beijingensis]|uniref:NADH-quinone oxidoreductase subunit J n=1 Tax=Pseudopedobacter beijingensis TaxID=1207056 RepID=A0ABW4IFI2_9SPHI